MPKEASKCREWEKERRDRLKTGFTTLGKLLPCYDPSLTLCQAEILQKAATYIEELQAKIKELLSTEGTNKSEREEISKLHSRIKKLLIRNEQLANLVKDAGIKLPTECGVIKKFKNPRLWSNRITPEQAKILAKKEAQKENEVKKPKCVKKTSNKKKKNKSAVLPLKQRKAVKKSDFKVKSTFIGIKPPININTSINNLITVVSSQSCFIITNAPSNAVSQSATVKTTTVVTNSRIFSTPLVASSVQPTPSIVLAKTNTALKPLTPGTLIVTNGSLLPVLPQSTILSNPSPVINPLPTNNTTLIVVPKKNLKNTSPAANKSIGNSNATKTKIPTRLKPKIDLTRTTQVNKVPIPASRYANSFLLFPTTSCSGNVVKPVKSKVAQKRKIKSNKENSKVKKAVTTTTVVNGKSKKAEVVAEVLEEKGDEGENVKKNDKEETDVITKNNEELEPDLKKQKPCDVPECPASPKNTVVEDKIVVDEKAKSVESSDITSALSVNVNDVSVSEAADNPKTIVEVETTNESKVVDAIEKSEDTVQQKQSVTETDSITINSEITEEKSASDQKKELKGMEISDPLTHSELSNDIFAHLSHVSTGGQNPESTSPTAAFLLAFPIVSSLTSLKVTEVMEEETSDSQHGTPTLLQIGTMDTTKTTQSLTDNLTPNLLNLDNFSFFSAKDICNNFYPSFESSNPVITTASAVVNVTKNKEYTQLNVKNIKAVTETTTAAPQTIVTTTHSSVNVTKSYPILNSISSSVVTAAQNDILYSQKVSNPVPSVNSYNPPLTCNQVCYTNADANSNSQQTAKTKQNHNEKLPCTYYSTASSYSLPQYNTFNPFTDIPKTTSSYTNVSKTYNEPSYSNSSAYSYNYSSDNFNISYSTSKSNIKNDNKSFYGLNYSNSYDYKNNENQKYESRNQQFNMYYNQNHSEKTPAVQNQALKNNNHSSKSLNHNSSRQPVNWMTTPDFRQQDFLVPPFTKEMDFVPNSIYSTNSFTTAPQSTYFNSNTSLYPTSTDLHNTFGDSRKLDAPFVPITASTFQRNEMDENQFSWSPSKLPQLLDPSHNFVSSTLPTLVGDLALGTTQPFTEQKIENKNMKDNFRTKESNRRTNKSQTNFDNNQSNFLSVSQLVDHSKPESAPNRITSRRNSGNRSSKSNVTSKSNKRLQKATENKEQNYTNNKIASSDKSHIKHQSGQNNDFGVQNNADSSNWSANTTNNNSNNKNREHANKNAPSNYSAEALIGHQPSQVDSTMKQRHQENYSSVNKSLPVPFLTDNIISYFPPVDIPQENTFIQQNQNYQSGSFSHNFPSSIQSNSYSGNSFIPNTPGISTSYLPSTNFIPDIGNHDYNPVIPDNVFPHVGNRANNKLPPSKQNLDRSDDKRNISQTTSSTNCSINLNTPIKKVKRKQTADTNLPGLVDFSFLSMPGTINSPILPDEFHTHSNFLPPPTPTQLYPCKNPLYPKQPPDLVPSSLLPIPTVPRTGIQHPEISPSLNSVGTTSLTNFNLSTIFPEINKGSASLPNIYGDSNKSKDFLQRDFLTNPVQVPFITGKSNHSMSYINSTSTT